MKRKIPIGQIKYLRKMAFVRWSVKGITKTCATHRQKSDNLTGQTGFWRIV